MNQIQDAPDVMERELVADNEELTPEEKARLEAAFNQEVAKSDKKEDEKDPGEGLNKIFGKIRKK